jgi:PEP-CTERM motif
MKIFVVSLTFLALCSIASAAIVDCQAFAALGTPGNNVLNLSPGNGCMGGTPQLLFDTFAVTPGTSTIFLSSSGTGPTTAPVGYNLGFQIANPVSPFDVLFTYKVTAKDGLAEITGVDDSQSGTNVQINEIACSVAPGPAGFCATANQLAKFTNNGGTNVAATFAPQTMIWVIKDISGSGANGNSFISSFVNSQQTTGPTVPEPSTALLLGFGLCGLAGLSRRFRRG